MPLVSKFTRRASSDIEMDVPLSPAQQEGNTNADEVV